VVAADVTANGHGPESYFSADFRTKKALFSQGPGSGAKIMIFAYGHAPKHPAIDPS